MCSLLLHLGNMHLITPRMSSKVIKEFGLSRRIPMRLGGSIHLICGSDIMWVYKSRIYTGYVQRLCTVGFTLHAQGLLLECSVPLLSHLELAEDEREETNGS